ncbi:MAG: hypothetical protein WCH11_05820, partial [Bdellovibrio sp.]
MIFFLLLSLQQTQASEQKEPEADLYISSEATPPDSSLKVKSSGVPAFEFIHRKSGTRVTHLPQLKLGKEARVKFRNQNLEISKSPPKVSQIFRKLSSPLALVAKSQAPALNASQRPPLESPKKIPAPPEFQEVPPPGVSEVQIRLREVPTISAAELKLIHALIFLELHQNYGLAFGLLSELLREPKEIRTQAAFHLGLSAKALGLYSEFKYQLHRILIDSTREWQKIAAQFLADGAGSGDLDLVHILDPRIEDLQLEIMGADQYQINRARLLLKKNDLSAANSALAKIAETSPMLPENRMLQALLSYREGQVESAVRLQKEALDSIDKLRPKSDLKSAIALTLARMQFQLGDYKQAFQSYLEVAKTHAEWPEAMIEQAWAQILMKDPEGAAGNMFSLHTDFLKHRFAPESYVARAVGYLNL